MIRFFHTPAPKRFTYKPRYFDPLEEELESVKIKHRIQLDTLEVDQETLDYYKSKVSGFDKQQKQKSMGLFSKKKGLPKFSYQARFTSDPESADAKKPNTIHFHSIYEDQRVFAKPIPTSKIFIFAAIAVLLIVWILL